MGAAEHAAAQPAVRGLDYLDTDEPDKVRAHMLLCSAQWPCIASCKDCSCFHFRLFMYGIVLHCDLVKGRQGSAILGVCDYEQVASCPLHVECRLQCTHDSLAAHPSAKAVLKCDSAVGAA